MSSNTSIEWTGSTWTPIRARLKAPAERTSTGWHCERVSPGCANCYAARMNKWVGTGLDYKPTHRSDLDVFLDEKILTQPLRWKDPRKVFVCSMTDLFADFVTDDMIDCVFAVMALAGRHTFQVLTKRAERMHAYFAAEDLRERIEADMVGLMDALVDPLARRSDDLRATAPDLEETWPLPNVWLGVSVEDQQRANERIPLLLQTPAAVRFLSVEPLLGPVDLSRYLFREIGAEQRNAIYDATMPGRGDDAAYAAALEQAQRSGSIGWVIVGGESGHHARPMDLRWVQQIVDHCQAARVAVFVKQMGERLTVDGSFEYPRGSFGPKGGDFRLFPVSVRVREFPGGAR